MPASPNQLDDIFRQVTNYFTSHPVISVNPTKGNPPDQYEITYTINGICKTGEGQVIESTNHKVELTIPFGFPHFPPSCKPKSDTFHPDFDPAAICLGDFWEQDRPLSDLIIHIGQMINGEIYSTNNSFNEEAAEWYLNNSGRLPFASIKWEAANISSPYSSNLPQHTIDTLDDGDLTSQFDFLALEQGGVDESTIAHPSFNENDPANEINHELLRLLEKQKKYFTLLETCRNNSTSSKELDKVCLKARDEVQRAEKLHRDAKKFENKGSARIALEKFEEITGFVSDFPAIDSDIQRIQQTLALLEDTNLDLAPDFSESDVSSKSVVADKKATKKGEKPSPVTTKKTKTIKSPPASDLFVKNSLRKNKLFLFSLLIILLVGIGSGGYFWFYFTDKLRSAEDAYAQCSTSHSTNQFALAKRSCDKALELVREVRFFHQDFAQQLEKFILEILQSEKLTQGLAGNILFEDKYLPKVEAEKLLSIKQKFNDAEKLYLEKKWQLAAEGYTILLTQTEKNSYLSPSIIEEIKRKQLISEFRFIYDPAQVLLKDGRWEDALEKLLQAQKILVSLPKSDREKYSEQLQSELQKSQFANLKAQGDLSFTGSDWLSAIAAYNLALASGQKTKLPPESIEVIRANIKRAELYTIINTGNKAFASGAWNDAIEAYRKASYFLSGSHGISKEKDSDVNIKKLSRIILQASIIRDRQIVQTLIDKNDLTNVKFTYQQILTNIEQSPFSSEEEFSNIKAEIGTAMQSLDQKIYLMKRVEYLTDNYQSLFIANYPNSSPENLTNPVISSTKETDSKLVFRMQCTENDGGRPLTLVMLYAYDKKTGGWSFFSEN